VLRKSAFALRAIVYLSSGLSGTFLTTRPSAVLTRMLAWVTRFQLPSSRCSGELPRELDLTALQTRLRTWHAMAGGNAWRDASVDGLKTGSDEVTLRLGLGGASGQSQRGS
jgi:hypothetical protein